MLETPKPGHSLQAQGSWKTGGKNPELNKGCLGICLGLTVTGHTSCPHNCICEYNSQRSTQFLEASELLSGLGFLPVQASHSPWTEQPWKSTALWIIRASTLLPVNYFLNQGHPPRCTQGTILLPNLVTGF